MPGKQGYNCPLLLRIAACVWKAQHFIQAAACKKRPFSTFPFRQNDGGTIAADSLFCRTSGIIGSSEKKGGSLMSQPEMEALIQLQKETIESLRQLADSQRLTIGQMAKSHEEQTAQHS